MSILRDLYYTNRYVLSKTAKLFINNWYIVFAGIFYFIAEMILGRILVISGVGILGIVGSIIAFIARGALISNFFYILYKIVRTGKVKKDDLKEGFNYFFRKVITIIVIGSLAGYIYSVVIHPLIGSTIPFIDFIIWIAILVILNPLGETIYLRYDEPWESITYSFKFVGENWIEWFLPNILMIGGLYLITGNVISILDINYNFNIFINTKSLLFNVIGQVAFTFIMIYRGVLFEELSTSTRRKRQFKRNIYN